MWGPGRIPAGTTCDQLVGTIDVLPTIAALTGKKLPAGRKIDGLDASALLRDSNAKSPRNEFLHYTSQGALEGIRQGKWKLLVKQKRQARRGKGKTKGKKSSTPPAPEIYLFDLHKDLGEQTNLAESNPKIVKTLRNRMAKLDAEITANARAPWFKN
jgi:arylsulfatase A